MVELSESWDVSVKESWSGANLRKKLCALQVANQSINQTNDNNNVKSLDV